MTGFVVGNDGSNDKCGTGILLQDANDPNGSERPAFFETAMNTAGMFAKRIAELGNQALCEQVAGSAVVLSALPQQQDKLLAGLVFAQPFVTTAPVYPVINVEPDGSSLGPHCYEGAFVDPEKPELGGWGVGGTSSHIISNLSDYAAPFNPDFNARDLSPKMIQQMRNFISGFAPSMVTERKLSVTSQIFRPRDPYDPKAGMVRDFYAGAALCVERNFALLSGFFNDTPGGSTWASVGRGMARGGMMLNKTPAHHALAVHEALYPRLRFNVTFG